MKAYTDKKGISHEETLEFDEKDPRDVATKKWFDKGLNPPTPTSEVEKIEEEIKAVASIIYNMGKKKLPLESAEGTLRESLDEWTSTASLSATKEFDRGFDEGQKYGETLQKMEEARKQDSKKIRHKLNEIFGEANAYGAREHYEKCLDEAVKFIKSLDSSQ